MPVIQFKGKTAIESYHHTVHHHTLEFDPKLSVLPKGEKPSLNDVRTSVDNEPAQMRCITTNKTHDGYFLVSRIGNDG